MPKSSTYLQRYKWLFFGTMSTLGYGLWGLFDRYSTFQSPLLSNLILYSTTVIIALALVGRHKRRPTRSAILSGLCGGMINLLVLYSLLSQNLILVYPFVSFGTIFFMMLYHIHFRPKYTRSQRILMYVGATTAILGLLSCGIGISGGFVQVATTYSLNMTSIALGLGISVFTGFWIFFAYLTISEDNFHPRGAALWIFLGSLMASIISLLVSPSTLGDMKLTQDTLFPVMGGICMFAGEIAAYYAFSAVDISSSIEQVMVVILANGELIPIMLFSYFVLHEATIEGFIGAALVLLGLVILNKARQVSER